MICLTGDKIYDPQQMIKIRENQNNEMKQSLLRRRSAEWNLSMILWIFVESRIMKDKIAVVRIVLMDTVSHTHTHNSAG